MPGHRAGDTSDNPGLRSPSLNRSADEYEWSDQYIIDFKATVEDLGEPGESIEPNKRTGVHEVDILIFNMHSYSFKNQFILQYNKTKKIEIELSLTNQCPPACFSSQWDLA